MFRVAALIALTLVTLAALANAQADFAWGVASKKDYPIFVFDNDSTESEVEFKYDFEGTLSENKFLESKLYQNDCITPADASLAFIDSIVDNELTLDIDIIQETITDSVHYTSTDDLGTSAAISFCVRVDYYYKGLDGNVESINFHETLVDISVDLTANFTLTSIATDRTNADAEDATAALDYPVVAYYCNDDNSEVDAVALAQGSSLQVCVRMDESVTEEVHVSDILTFVVSQPDGPASSTTTIEATETDPLTAKDCASNQDGICNVKTQLPSKFFVEPVPADLQVDGVAILAFGAPVRRLVGVPIQQTSVRKKTQESRNLQDQTVIVYEDAPTKKKFDLNVELARTEYGVSEDGTIYIPVMLMIIVSVAITLIICVMCCCCDLIYDLLWCCCCGRSTRRRRRHYVEEDEVVRKSCSRRENYVKETSQSTVIIHVGSAEV